MEQNPFAPPSASTGDPGHGGLVFSPEGAQVVSSLAAWMRGLSIFYYLGVGLLALGSCGVVATGAGGVGFPMLIALLLAAVLIGLAASWLRGAASGFERGVFSDDEFTIGQGFRSLRAYLILFGIFGILNLMGQIYQAIDAL